MDIEDGILSKLPTILPNNYLWRETISEWSPMTNWYVYILQCADQTLYTGITTDVERRVEQHNDGTAAKYTASRIPVVLKYVERADNRSEASKRERAIKQMSRAEKLSLIRAH